MPTHPPGRQHPFGLNGRFTFFKGFLRRPAVVGSIIPSSRFLERRIVAAAEIAQARTVVELGPGTGGTTQAILNALPPTSRLLTLEIDPGFVSYLRSFPDPRLCVHLGSAERIGETLAEHGLARPDAVVSGIPFSNMPAECGRRILRAVWACLVPGGRFVAYQFVKRVAELDPATLGTPEVALEFLNVPPVRIFRWCKPMQAADAPDERHAVQRLYTAGSPPS
ncbi:MAG: methyltransferase type 12 [Desulfobacteraceae bacterium]|nr:MAG: methyltransferase type 12 [Desulfobacteraceae bacterium]